MKIVFLDFDGVVITPESRKQGDKARKIFYGGWAGGDDGHEFSFDRELLRHIQFICQQTNAKIVVISQWRLYRDAHLIPTWFIERGLTIEVVGYTEDLATNLDDPEIMPNEHKDRADEIAKWLEEHPEVSSFVILDDMQCAGRLHPVNFILCNPNIGITKEQCLQAINILGPSHE